MAVTIGRRELLAALGGAVAWPLAASGARGCHSYYRPETYEPALVSAVDGAGSAMLFSVAAAI